MSAEAWMIVLFAAGLVFPAFGLLHGYFGSRARLARMRRQYGRYRELMVQYSADHAAILAREELQWPEQSKLIDALEVRLRSDSEAAGLKGYTLGEVDLTGQSVTIDITTDLVKDLGWDLIVIGTGLACATAASIWAVAVTIV